MQDAEAVFAIISDINSLSRTAGFFHVENLDNYKHLILRVALCARGLISPMCALMGGIVAQEVLKAAGGKNLLASCF